MKPTTGLVTCSLTQRRRLFLGGAADLADHTIAFGLGVGLEQLQQVDEGRADDRVAADADAGRLAEARGGELADRFVGERAAARDDADAPWLVDVAGHDADLGLAGRDDAGAVRADQPRRGWSLEVALDPDHVEDRDAFGDADDERDAGVGRLEDRVGGERRRHEDHRGVGAGRRRPPRRRCRRPARPRRSVPPLPGVTPATTRCRSRGTGGRGTSPPCR